MTPAELGRRFRRVQYRYHAAFFDALGAPEPAARFARIWALCARWADPAELADHTPQVDGTAPTALAARVARWSTAERAELWAALSAVLAAEAAADAARGRSRLSNMLEAARAALQQLH